MRWIFGVFGFMGLVLASGCDKPSGEGASLPSAASASATAVPVQAPSIAPSAPAAPSAVVAAPDTIIAQHVLVIYKGAKRAPKTVTRSKADAKARAGEALAKVRAGSTFEDVVKEYSD